MTFMQSVEQSHIALYDRGTDPGFGLDPMPAVWRAYPSTPPTRREVREEFAVNKAQLVDAVADKVGSRVQAAAAVECVLDAIVRSVARGEAVSVTGFGTLLPKARPSRTAHNPRTGSEMTVAPIRVVRFRPGARFQDLVAGRRQMPESGNCIQMDPKAPASSAARP